MRSPDKQEQALALRRGGKKLREIGKALQISVGHAHSLCARAQEAEDQGPATWTAGLPAAVANVLRARHIKSHAELTKVIEDGSLLLMPRIGQRRFDIIVAWWKGQ
jgi:hypothetical protein